MNRIRIGTALGTLVLIAAAPLVVAQIIGEGPRLDPNRPTQEEIETGIYTLDQLRTAGEVMFTTPFNLFDGYGDGPINPLNTRDPGGRPVLGNQGTTGQVLRVNGKDSQSCLDCHGLRTLRTIPGQFAVGGFGNLSNSVIARPTTIDVADEDRNGIAEHNGRLINPPFSFGAGGVEMLAKEMTRDLRTIAQQMLNAGYPHSRTLVSKGVYFGVLHLVEDQAVAQKSTSNPGDPTSPIQILPLLHFDFKDVVGLNEPQQLRVDPFGRKGTNLSIRDFDLGAMRFHFGMEAQELFPGNPDHDGDGVPDELLPGDFSVLTIFQGLLPRPYVASFTPDAEQGYRTFIQIGCAYCHRPVLSTASRYLPVSYPEVRNLFVNGRIADPFGNAFYQLDLNLAGFDTNPAGGVYVPLFADLKRHAMGPLLEETSDETTTAGNQTFTTARLWGVCDTEPYLHDGRAFDLHEAILEHGGEAEGARITYDYLSEYEKNLILSFLCTLRTPPAAATTGSGGVSGQPAPPAEGETSAATLLQIYNEEVANLGP